MLLFLLCINFFLILRFCMNKICTLYNNWINIYTLLGYHCLMCFEWQVRLLKPIARCWPLIKQHFWVLIMLFTTLYIYIFSCISTIYIWYYYLVWIVVEIITSLDYIFYNIRLDNIIILLFSIYGPSGLLIT